MPQSVRQALLARQANGAWDAEKSLLISLSSAKLVLLEVVARSKQRTDIQEKKGGDAMTFSSRDQKEWGLQQEKKGSDTDSWLK